jgi:hypothetical protein
MAAQAALLLDATRIMHRLRAICAAECSDFVTQDQFMAAVSDPRLEQVLHCVLT